MKIPSGTRKAVIACLGSSTTAAKGSFSWIGELEKGPQNQRFRFVNLGVGGDLDPIERSAQTEILDIREM